MKRGLWALAIVLIPGAIIVGVIMVLLNPAYLAKLYRLLPIRRDTRAALRNAFIERGLNPDYIDAIAYVESRWNPNATNLKGADLGRGGAFGSTQLTLKTLQSIGYSGDGYDLLGDADAQGKWSAVYMERANPQSFADAVAWWNAGRKRFDQLPEDHITRTQYWPLAESVYNQIAEAA